VNFLGVNSRDSRVKEVSIISVMYSNRINKWGNKEDFQTHPNN
jgi:hypothetical protein